MAWTTIPDGNLAPDADALSTDALALRDNPIAIAQGLAGAPKILTAGLNDGAVTHVKSTGLAGMLIFTGYKTGAGNTILNATIDWRDRFITLMGGTGKDANEAQAQTWLPGGSEDNDIYNGFTQGSSSVVTTTMYIPAPYFMYSKAGSAAYNTAPFIRHETEAGVTSIWLWVNSANGSLNLYSDVGNTVAWNLIVGYGPDQGEH